MLCLRRLLGIIIHNEAYSPLQRESVCNLPTERRTADTVYALCSQDRKPQQLTRSHKRTCSAVIKQKSCVSVERGNYALLELYLLSLLLTFIDKSICKHLFCKEKTPKYSISIYTGQIRASVSQIHSRSILYIKPGHVACEGKQASVIRKC